jgi:hypothetical protein
LSEVEFIKDVSGDEPAAAGAPVRLAEGERVIVLQSGQIRPDASLLAELEGRCEAVPMSGVPSQHAVGGRSLRQAAQAGRVAKIFAYWGSIETDVQPMGTKAVSWVPVAGWYIPDESQRMRVLVSGIVADVVSGRWADFHALSDETEISRSFMNSQWRDAQQVEELKKQAYKRIVQRLMTRP